MTEIQRLLTETIESLIPAKNATTNPALVSVLSVNIGAVYRYVRCFFCHPGGDVAVETLSGSVWLLVVLFILLNGSSFSMSTHATAMKISTCWISRLL